MASGNSDTWGRRIMGSSTGSVLTMKASGAPVSDGAVIRACKGVFEVPLAGDKGAVEGVADRAKRLSSSATSCGVGEALGPSRLSRAASIGVGITSADMPLSRCSNEAF